MKIFYIVSLILIVQATNVHINNNINLTLLNYEKLIEDGTLNFILNNESVKLQPNYNIMNLCETKLNVLFEKVYLLFKNFNNIFKTKKTFSKILLSSKKIKQVQKLGNDFLIPFDRMWNLKEQDLIKEMKCVFKSFFLRLQMIQALYQEYLLDNVEDNFKKYMETNKKYNNKNEALLNAKSSCVIKNELESQKYKCSENKEITQTLKSRNQIVNNEDDLNEFRNFFEIQVDKNVDDLNTLKKIEPKISFNKEIYKQLEDAKGLICFYLQKHKSLITSFLKNGYEIVFFQLSNTIFKKNNEDINIAKKYLLDAYIDFSSNLDELFQEAESELYHCLVNALN